jgi:hypothetical protein
MELVLPTTLPITIGAVGAFLTLFASIIGVFWKLRGQVQHLEGKVDSMAERNKRADDEAEAIKNEQAAQKTTVAVMAEQIGGITRTLERIDRNVEGLVKGSGK